MKNKTLNQLKKINNKTLYYEEFEDLCNNKNVKLIMEECMAIIKGNFATINSIILADDTEIKIIKYM